VTCHSCKIEAVKAGRHRTGVQRWKCQQCGKRFQDAQQKPFGADVRLPQETVCRILHCLVEGNSVRGTARLCGVEKRTVLNYLTMAGEACERLFAERVRNVNVGQLQADEIWTYCKVKQCHLRPDHDERVMGDAYTFIGLDRAQRRFSFAASFDLVGWRAGRQLALFFSIQVRNVLPAGLNHISRGAEQRRMFQKIMDRFETVGHSV
jgi:transposase-like protein